MVLVSRIVAALILGIAGYQVGDSSGLTRRLPGYAEIALNFGVLIVLGAIILASVALSASGTGRAPFVKKLNFRR